MARTKGKAKSTLSSSDSIFSPASHPMPGMEHTNHDANVESRVDDISSNVDMTAPDDAEPRRRSLRLLAQSSQTDYDSSSEEPMDEKPDVVTQGEGARRSVATDQEASRLVLLWVRSNYQYEPEHNVPRRGMYDHYVTYCHACNAQIVNSATFGKLIRTVFPKLKTRRLGTRGQSKYHYCGIRRKHSSSSAPDSLLQSKRPYSSSPGFNSHWGIPRQGGAVTSFQPHITGYIPDLPHHITRDANTTMPHLPSLTARRMEYGGDAYYSNAEITLPPFKAPVLRSNNPHDFETLRAAMEFTDVYWRHCCELLSLVRRGQLINVENCLNDFYKHMPDRFRQLIQCSPEVSDVIWRWDCALYDAIIAGLLPKITSPMSQDMFRNLRQYTRELEQYLEKCLKDYPCGLYRKKSDVARIFVAKFRRQLSLNHMAQTASAVLRRPDDMRAMAHDWEGVDFGGVIDQALWICDCNNNEIEQILHNDIWNLLRPGSELEQWIAWIKQLVDKYMERELQKHHTRTFQDHVSLAKKFILKWNFYTSLIMKDLAIRSATSIGLFHILRAFFDDLVMFLVEEGIAKVNLTSLPQEKAPQPPEFDHGEIPDTPPPSSSSTSHHILDRPPPHKS